MATDVCCNTHESKPDYHLKYLDALRGYAIAGVFMAHFLHDFAIAFPKFLRIFGFGVTLFYVLSAYCLMLSLNRSGRPANWLNYSIRRFFRIAPAFYVAIAFWSLLQIRCGQSLNFAKLATSITFLNGFIPAHIHSSIPHGWSIAVETSFYVILPLIFLHIRDLTRALVVLAIAIPLCVILSWGLPLLLAYSFPDGNFNQFREYTIYWLPAQMPVFLLGITAYFIVHGQCPTSRTSRKFIESIPGVGICLLIFAGLAAGYLPTRIAHVVVAGCCAGGIIWFSSKPSSRLINPFMTRLGIVSFSAYLIHQLAINLSKTACLPCDNGLAKYPAFLYAVILTLILSNISHKFIEKPGIAFGAKIIQRRKPFTRNS